MKRGVIFLVFISFLIPIINKLPKIYNLKTKLNNYQVEKNDEEKYEIKYLSSSQFGKNNKNILVYSNLTFFFKNKKTYQKVEIFKMDLDSGKKQKFMEIIKQAEHAPPYVEKLGNYIGVFLVGKKKTKVKIFDLFGNPIKNFKLSKNSFIFPQELVFSENGKIYTYSPTLKQDSIEVINTSSGKIIVSLSIEEIKRKTKTEKYFENSQIISPTPLILIGFSKDNNYLYFALRKTNYPSRLFQINLKTKEIKEIKAGKSLYPLIEYKINSNKDLLYGMTTKSTKIDFKKMENEYYGEAFLIDLKKDKYKPIYKKNNLLKGDFIIDKEGRYFVFNFVRLTKKEGRFENLEPIVYYTKTKKLQPLSQLKNLVIYYVLKDGRLIYEVPSKDSHQFYILDLLKNKNKKILEGDYKLVDIWEK